MSKHTPIYILLIILLLVQTVSGVDVTIIPDRQYPNYYLQDSTYRGYFNADTHPDGITTDDYHSVSVDTNFATNRPIMPTLVYDFDGDGVNEIAVANDQYLDIYRKTLSGLVREARTDLGATVTWLDYVNWSGSDLMEIMVTTDDDGSATWNNGTLYNITHNGTALAVNFTGYDWDNQYDGYYAFKCEEEDDGIVTCFHPWVSSNSWGFEFVRANGTINSTIIATGGTVRVCPTMDPFVAYDDYDVDGDNEWVWSLITQSDAVGIKHVLYRFVEMDHSTWGTVLYSEISSGSAGVNEIGYGDTCFTQATPYVASGILVDFDGTMSNGWEVATVHEGSTNDHVYNAGYFKLIIYRTSDGSIIEESEYMGDEAVTMEKISNVVKGHIFDYAPEYYAPAFFGYDSTTKKMHMISMTDSNNAWQCYNVLYGTGDEEIEVEIDVSNYTFSTLMMVQGVEMTGGDKTEFITPFSIISLNGYWCWESVIGITQNNLIEIVDFGDTPLDNYAFQTVDYDEIGKLDIVGTSPTSLVYIDDAYSNTAPYIVADSGELDPCVSRVWLTNTSVLVSFAIQDNDDDEVQAGVKLYSGEAFEQDTGWIGNYTSPNTYSFIDAVANHTGSNYELEIYWNDNTGGHDTQTETFLFSVSDSGSGEAGGSCVTVFGDGSTASEDEAGSDEDDAFVSLEDAQVQIKTTLFGALGISSGYAPLFAILIIIVSAIAVIITILQHGGNDVSSIGAGVITSFSLWVFFIWLEFIPPWTMLVFLMMSVLIIGLFFGKRVTGGG